MHSKHIMAGIGAAALMAMAPAAAFAQDTVNTTDPYATTTVPVEEEDNDFPWGLLGLLGLAGLIPRKSHSDIHVDNRTKP